jgi:tetratricopeptide (TPR) repeat protein
MLDGMRWCCAAVLVLSAACASTPAPPNVELKRELSTVLAPDELVIPFEVDPAWVKRAREELVLVQGDANRAQALIDLLNDPDGFDVQYDAHASLTANEALERRRGNCFSYAAIVVGLARALGLRAEFAEYDHENVRYERWSMIVRSSHITAVVQHPDGFVAMEYGTGIRRRWNTISDRQAIAHYYNNRGFMRLAQADAAKRALPWTAAAADFTRAVRLEDGFYRGWNNLGVAMARVGNEEAALLHYERALAYAPEASTAHLNLGVLLLRRGAFERAVNHFERAAVLRPEDQRARRLLERTLALAK